MTDAAGAGESSSSTGQSYDVQFVQDPLDMGLVEDLESDTALVSTIVQGGQAARRDQNSRSICRHDTTVMK